MSVPPVILIEREYAWPACHMGTKQKGEPDVTKTPNVPARRDVKGMTDLLKGLKSGESLQVVFKSDKYGVFTVTGPAFCSRTVSLFMVGSLAIESGGKPEKSVLSIEACSVSASGTGSEDTAVWSMDDPESLQGCVDGLAHGDLVRATFQQQPHGRFTVEGVVVPTEAGDIKTVGSWFITSDGKAAVRMQALELQANVGEHGYPIPSVITSWESGEESLA
jgi:hypothetical protein